METSGFFVNLYGVLCVYAGLLILRLLVCALKLGMLISSCPHTMRPDAYGLIRTVDRASSLLRNTGYYVQRASDILIFGFFRVQSIYGYCHDCTSRATFKPVRGLQ